jgi:anti-anti-sigma factor
MKKKVLGLIGTLEIELLGTDDVMVIDLAGQIDSYSAEEVSKLIEAHIHNQRVKVIVDLNKITYLDSAALSMLIKNKISLSKRGGDLRLVGVKAKAKEVFELAGLLGMFGIYESREDAFEGF